MEAGAVRSARLVVAAAGIAVAGVYLARAAVGLPAAIGFGRAWVQSRAGDLEAGIETLARGETGAQRFEAAWLKGDLRLGIWDRLAPEKHLAAEGRLLLDRAASDFLRAAESAPAAAGPRIGLAALYLRRELAAAAMRPFELSRLDEGPWARVGPEGRVAVGLLRMATASEPNGVSVHDHLVTTLLALGLVEPARDAMREAGRVQPLFHLHERFRFDDLPRALLEAFAEGAREALGRTPMLARERHLLALGQFERRLGRIDRAAADLRAAHAEPAGPLEHAESAFYLGLVLADLGDFEAGRPVLEEAAAHPVFRGSAFEARSRLEEKAGSDEQAFLWAERAFTVDPTSPDRALRFGALARRLGRESTAEKAYRRVLVSRTDHVGLHAALVETLLELGDPPAAARALEAMTGTTGESAETARLAERLAHARLGTEVP